MAEDGQPSAEGVEVVHGPPGGAYRRQAGSIQWIPLSSTAEKVRLLPAHVSRYAHDDASARARPVVTREVVSFLLGYERPRNAVTASYAVVQSVLRWKFLTAGAVVAVAAPFSVRSFHLRGVTVAAVALRRAIRRSVVRVPVQDIPPVGVLYGIPRIVLERPVMSVFVSRAFARELAFKPVVRPVGCQPVSRFRLSR